MLGGSATRRALDASRAASESRKSARRLVYSTTVDQVADYCLTGSYQLALTCRCESDRATTTPG
jgi:hypothetical protein